MSAQQFAQFILKKSLGSGGYGQVYLAYDPRRKHDVALKLLSGGQFLNDDGRRRFIEEAYFTMQLEHEAIVPVYDFGDCQGQLYMEIRLMGGGSLADRLQRGPLSVAEAGIVMDRICSALDFAHSRNIIHRDLKPGNILFDENGAPWLADFGLARVIEKTRNMTQVGTLFYMSPEQINGTTQDARTDVFQMGAVLFEMLTGNSPFAGPTTVAVLQNILTAPVPSAHRLNHKLPSTCDQVFQKALAKQPGQRFQSTGELARAYRKAAGLPPAVQIIPGRHPGPAGQPNRRKWSLTAVLLLALAAWSILYAVRAIPRDAFLVGAAGVAAILLGRFLVVKRITIARSIVTILKLVLVVGVIALLIYFVLRVLG